MAGTSRGSQEPGQEPRRKHARSWEHWLQRSNRPSQPAPGKPCAFGMKTALTLFLLLMTTTGCALPLKLLQALLPAPKPVPDVTPYPKKILRDIVPGQKIDWIGNDTVVFAGYPVNTRGKSWLYSWDMKTAPKQLLEGPRSFCVNGDTVMLSTGKSSEGTAKSLRILFPSNKTEYLETKQPKEEVRYGSRYTCRANAVPAPLVKHTWKELRPGDGYLDFGLDDIRNDSKVTHLDANLRKRQDTGIRVDLPILGVITDWHPQPGYLLYDINLSPEERRRWLQSNNLTLWHLDAQHQGHALNGPRPFAWCKSRDPNALIRG